MARKKRSRIGKGTALVALKHKPKLKPSPKGFAWPDQKAAKDPALRQRFAARLNELNTQRGWHHTDLGRVLFGEEARNNNTLTRAYVTANAFPKEGRAEDIARAYDVSVASLLEPRGKFVAPTLIRGGRPKPNGHAGNGADLSSSTTQPAPLERPADLAAPVMKWETYAPDPRFVSLSVVGVVTFKQAMQVATIVNPLHGLDA